MKKSILLGGAALLTLAMTACGNCGDTACGNDRGHDGIDKVYTGVIPAADCDGIRYTLTLDYDHDDNDGDYRLVETYLRGDSTAMIGYRDIATFYSEGDFRVKKQGEKTYLELVKDAKDSSAGSIDTPIYFVVDSDSTITLANDQLEVPQTPGLNYTLKVGN